ncbi:MAG TPA: hypothetical protein VFF27_09410 [Bacteroidia bacterium]|jgi:hypothetical protein|nr:hypothetical protein [Bacteroidia bacterium]
MAIYRFKVSFEDNEEIYREIEIKSTQTFEDFHNVIVQAINFDNQHNSSFFISDDYWRKGDEIVLRNSDNADAPRRRQQESDTPKKLMNKCKMASLIDDPHQKFVFVYDPKTGWTFLVELLKIVPDDAKASYPRVVKSSGEAPKQYKPSTVAAATLDDEDFDEDEPHAADDAAYENAHSEDETALLESEEGEEEETEAEEEELVDSDEEDASEYGEHSEENFDEN